MSATLPAAPRVSGADDESAAARLACWRAYKSVRVWGRTFMRKLLDRASVAQGLNVRDRLKGAYVSQSKKLYPSNNFRKPSQNSLPRATVAMRQSGYGCALESTP
jgi:hypothetical protein